MNWPLLFLFAWFVAVVVGTSFGILLLRAAAKTAPVPERSRDEAQAGSRRAAAR